MLAAGLLALSLAGQVAVDVEASVRSDMRAGLSPGFSSADGGPQATPTAELAFTPSLGTEVDGFGVRGAVVYAPTLQLRTQFPSTAGVLGQHTGRAALATGDEARWGELTFEGSFSAGRHDLGAASRLLGQPAGAGVGGAFSLADTRLRAQYAFKPLRRLRVYGAATGALIALPAFGAEPPPGLDFTAFLLLPDMTQLVPRWRTEFEGGAEYQLTRRTQVGLVTSLQTVDEVAPVAFRGLQAAVDVRHYFFRNLSVRGAVGGLTGFESNLEAEPSEIRTVASPYADAQIDASLNLARDLQLTGSAGASIVPSYDLFLSRVTHRFSTRAGGSLVWQDLSVRLAASTFSLLPELNLGATRVSDRQQPLDVHVATGELAANYALFEELHFGGGLYGFLRGQAATGGPSLIPSRVLPETIAFFYVRASTTYHRR